MAGARQSAMRFLESFTRASSKPKLHSNRSQRGMFAGKDVRFGNKTCFSDKKSRRKWLPNVQNKKLWSELLQERVQLKVTTTALRGVDKAGGLDNYLLYTTDDRLRSSQADAVKKRILEALGDGAEARIQAVHSMLKRRLKGLAPGSNSRFPLEPALASGDESE